MSSGGQNFSRRLKRNVSWIFFGNVTYALLQFLLNLYVAHRLSLEAKGLVDYAASWITMLTAVASLGYNGMITREMTEHADRQGDYLCSCMVSYAVTGVLCMGVLQVIVRLMNPGEPLLYLITLCQSTSIVFSSLNLFVYWYRFSDHADTAALLRLLAFALSALWRIVALQKPDGLILYVIGTAAEALIFGAFLGILFFCRYKGSFRYSIKIAVSVLKKSYPFIFAGILGTIYGQADRIMLKSMIGPESVALYSAAAMLAGALSMIPSSLIEGFRPDIMEYKFSDENLYLKRFRQLYAVIFWASIAYCVFVTLFARPIMMLTYGEKYAGAVGALSLIVWYTAFSYFGSVNNMYMVAENKNRWVQIITLIGAAGNILLNAVMIPRWGIAGAALASLLTQVLANFIMMWLIPDLRSGFYNMIRGIALRDIR